MEEDVGYGHAVRSWTGQLWWVFSGRDERGRGESKRVNWYVNRVF